MADKDKVKALEKLKKKRANLRSTVTICINKIYSELELEACKTETIEELYHQLIEKEKELNTQNDKIEELLDVDELDKEFESSNEYNDKICSAKFKANKCLEKIKIRSRSPPRSAQSGNRSESKFDESKPKTNVKLQKLVIQPYDGSLENWNEFWGHFENSIDKNNDLTNLEKFSYLKSLLKGSALIAVQGLSISDSNYNTAIDILKERYGNKDLIISSHINKLLKLTPVRKLYQLRELRKLYDDSIVQIRCLDSLGVQIKSYGNLLFPILAQLMPEEIVLEFNRRQKKEHQWDVSELLEYLRAEIENRERSSLMRMRTEEKQVSDIMPRANFDTRKSKEIHSKHYERPKYAPTASVLNTASKNLCIFCSKEHVDLSECKVSIEDKRKLLLRHGRCFNCLQKYHRSSTCLSKLRCSNCNGKHNIRICEENESKSKKIELEPKKSETIPTVVSSVSESQGEVLLQTASAIAGNRSRSLKIRVLFDTGSEKTFIDEQLSKRLRLKVIGEESLMIYSFGDSKPQKCVRKRVLITLKNTHDDRQKITIEALEVPNISSAVIKWPGEALRRYCSQNNMCLADLGESEIYHDPSKISLLIGSDCYWRIVYGNVRRLPGGMAGMNTLLGWVLSGPCYQDSVRSSEIRVMKVIAREENIEESVSHTVKKFWELESLGILDNGNVSDRVEQDQILAKFERDIEFKDRYEVKLPFNENKINLDDNYVNASARFRKLISRFRKDETFFERYKAVISRQISDGIVERVNSKVPVKEALYYMPHQAVIREEKSTKFRVVYDASSSSSDALSLNDCLHSGPNLNPDLLTLLLKFRFNKVSLTGDIEQAFLQISLAREDRDSLRFLFVNENTKLENFTQPETFRMTRVPFGATSSPFLLAATIKFHIKKYKESFPKAFEKLNEELYVDDLITGEDSVENIVALRSDAKQILAEGKFNLRKFRTNIQSLQREWVKEENCEYSATSKVLGYVWNSEEDVLKIDVSKISLTSKPEVSKREVLQLAGKVYDPIGLISPFTVSPKIMFQEIWKRNLEWNENISPDLFEEWMRWFKELCELDDIEVPRHYFSSFSLENIFSLELHCFTDASKRAYGAVIYFRFTNPSNDIETVLVTSKSRVAPLHDLTLPRKELLAAVIGARLCKFVQKSLPSALKVTEYLWSDSMITLHWIQGNKKKLKTFVKNRITEINSLTNATSWRHCPTQENPADFLSRGQSLRKLKENELWWHGPQWLRKDESFWPNAKIEDCLPNEAAEECETIRSFFIAAEIILPFEIQRFSKLEKVLRITSYVFRFINNLKNPLNQKKGSLSPEELEEAEAFWIRMSQREAFSEEIECLQKENKIDETSKLTNFNVFLDDKGILRIGGRLHFSDLSYEEKHPIILPNNDHITKLIINRSHLRTGHAGVSETFTDLREKFYVIRGRQMVKKLIFNCNLCKRFRKKPATQDMASLPPDRVREAFPFEVTGLDFLGPLYVREADGMKKCYVLLFTCAVTRAVHLELTPDMTARVFVLALKRFIARRGLCKIIYSDNAKSFKKTKKEIDIIQNCLQDDETLDYLGRQNIKWKFIVEKAAWWGGFWERLVRSVKMTLKKNLGKTSLTFPELETTIIEVEAILNSRPLTFVSSEARDFEPLTPGHFLIGRRLLSLPGSSHLPASTTSVLLRRHKHQKNVSERIWNRWRKNYLLELRSAIQTSNVKNPIIIKKDAIVQIHEDKIPKLMWKVGRITEVHLGRDNKPRSCTLILPTGTSIKRPVQLLYPLELSCD